MPLLWYTKPTDCHKKEDCLWEKHKQDVRRESPILHPRTPLAKRLWELRQEALVSGAPLLNLDEIRQELQARRGGVLDEEKA